MLSKNNTYKPQGELNVERDNFIDVSSPRSVHSLSRSRELNINLNYLISVEFNDSDNEIKFTFMNGTVYCEKVYYEPGVYSKVKEKIKEVMYGNKI